MLLKILFLLLNSILLSLSTEVLFNQLENVINQPGWRLMQNVNYIDGDNVISIDEIYSVTDDGAVLTKNSTDIMFQQLTTIMSCKYAKNIRDLINLVIDAILKCKVQDNNDMKVLFNCTNEISVHINSIGLIGSQMLDDFLYAYKLLLPNINVHKIYAALVYIKLYSTTYAKQINTVISDHDESQIHNVIDNIMKFLFSSDSVIQAFNIENCWPLKSSLRSNLINHLKLNISQKNEEKEAVSILSHNYIINKKIMKFQNFKSKFILNKESEQSFFFDDLNLIWNTLGHYQAHGYPIKIHWFGQTLEAWAIFNELKSQNKLESLANLQMLSIKALTHVLYTKVHNALLAYLTISNELKFKNVCPNIFLSSLKQNWLKLCKADLPAIGEACLSIKETKDKIMCKNQFIKTLQKNWLNYHPIDTHAVEVACSTMIENIEEPSSPRKLVSMGMNFINKLFNSNNENVAHPQDKLIDEKTFWESMKNSIIKIQSIRFPAGLVIPLNMFNNLMNHVSEHLTYEKFTKDVLGLLNIEIKKTSIVYTDALTKNNNPELHLKSLNDFVEDILKIGKQVEHTSLSFKLLQNDTLQTNEALYNLSVKINNSHNTNDCLLSKKLLEFLDFNGELIHMCTNIVSENRRSSCFSYVTSIGDVLGIKFEKISKQIFSNAFSTFNEENKNIQNALVLTLLYLNNIGWKSRTSVETEQNFLERNAKQYNPSSVRIDKFKRLNILISNQLENYVINNCDLSNYENTTLKILKVNRPHDYRNAIIDMCYKTLNSIELNDNQLIDNCSFNLSDATYKSLIDNYQTNSEWNPLKCVEQFQIIWNGTSSDIATIRKKVISEVDSVSLSKYQVLVLNVISSIVFGYMLNILQVNNNSLTIDDIIKIRTKLGVFEQIVFPFSKTNSSANILNLFVWSLEPSQITGEKYYLIKDNIESTVTSYGLELTNYYEVLKNNNIIRSHVCNVSEAAINPLISFIDVTLTPFKDLFKCVAQYMTLRT